MSDAPSRLRLERTMHRRSIAVSGESMATYALLKLIPPSLSIPRLPISVALVLDVSGSMYWADGTGQSRLERVREAVNAALKKLTLQDRISLVVFANGVQNLLPSTSLSERSKIEEALQCIDSCDLDQAGSTMYEGIRLALDEVGQPGASWMHQHVIVLTDGETSGEEICRELAQKAHERNIHLTVMGMGTEWNSALLKDLARLSQGRWYYINSEQPAETTRVFLQEFDRITNPAFMDVELVVSPMRDVRVKRVRQVTPQLREIPIQAIDEALITATLGNLERLTPASFILDLSLPKQPDGKWVVAEIEVKNHPVDGISSAQSISLEMTYTAKGNGNVNQEVARQLDEIQIFELNGILQQALFAENSAEAQRVARQIVRKAEALGLRAARKTLLAIQLLDELIGVGRVSRKTLFALDDASRNAAGHSVS